MNALVIKEGEEKTYFGDCAEITVERGAILHHYHIAENSADLNVTVEAGGCYDSLLLLSPSETGKGKLKINVDLVGLDAKAVSNAVYLLSGKADFSLSMSVNHLASSTKSSQHAKGILTGSSLLDFVGLIGMGTNLKNILGDQLNEAMILSDSAHLKCTPELSIMSEDVKCTHGASLGNLDEDGLFYLQSRGIPYNEAKYLMLSSFTNSLTDKIVDEEIKGQFCERINKWLQQNI